MDRRKLKRKVYRYRNMITYIAIFGVASIVTLYSAVGRNNKIVLVNESQMAATHKESDAIQDKTTKKVALKSEQETTIEYENKTGTIVVIAVDTLNVRSKPLQSSETMGLVNEGDRFKIISQNSKWIEIDYNGNNGFVKKEYVKVK